MARTQMKWDSAAHEAMLICIVKHCELNSSSMAKVLEDMQKKGYEFTENAFRYDISCRRHYPSSIILCLLLFSSPLFLSSFPLFYFRLF